MIQRSASTRHTSCLISVVSLVVFCVLLHLSRLLMSAAGGRVSWYAIMSAFALAPCVAGPRWYRLAGIGALALSIALLASDYKAGRELRKQWEQRHREWQALDEQVSISLDLTPEMAAAAIKSLGAVNITSRVGWKYAAPRKPTFWELRDYDTVILLIEVGGKVESISYWARKDFTPKDRRAETKQTLKAFTADTRTKKISIEKAR